MNIKDRLEVLKLLMFRRYKYLFSKPAWAIWRISLKGNGSKLRLGNGEILKIREVVTVLEMSIYFITSSRNSTQYDLSKDYLIPLYSYYVAIAELLYWRFIASYALSLAIELSQSPNATLPYLYRYVVPKLVRKVVLTKVRGSEELPNFSYITYTPYLLRLEGRGPCIAQSMASSLFASITLDAVVANAVIEVPNGSHIISLLVLPSTIFKSEGKDEVTLPVDVDGDGVNDSAIVLVDTAKPPINYVRTHIRKVYILGPLSYAPTLLTPNQLSNLSLSITTLFYAYFNYTKELLHDPKWAHTPWSQTTLRIHEALLSKLISRSLRDVIRSWYIAVETPSGYIHYWSTPIPINPENPFRKLRGYVELIMGSKYGVGEPRLGPNSLSSWVKLWINNLNYVIPLKESTPPSKYVQPKNIPKISIKAPMNTVPKTIETPLNCVRLMLRTPSVLRCSTTFRNEIELLRCVGKVLMP